MPLVERPPRRRFKILVAAEGSEGDNLPALAVARVLAARGHSVSACVTVDHVARFEDCGIEASAMGTSSREFFEAHAKRIYDRNASGLLSMYRSFAAALGRQFSMLLERAAGCDVLLGSGFLFAGATVAELCRAPLVHMVYAPVFFPTRHLPPPNISSVRLPKAVNSVLWKAFIASMDALALGPINAKRRELGMRSLESVKDHLLKGLVLAMNPEISPFPPGLRERRGDQLAYPALRDERELSPGVRSFLERGDPPAYIGFGSMLDPGGRATCELFRRACRMAGLRALLYFGSTDGTPAYADDDCMVIGREPHARLFPMTAAVVHHGGAGTTHAAAFAGVPQIPVCHLLDQYVLAEGVRTAGIGPTPLRRSRLSAESLAAALREAVSNPSYRERAREMASDLAKRDGAVEAADLVEKTARAFPLAYDPY